MGYFGVTFNPVVATSAFLLLGLGVDDSYVLIQAYHVAAKTLPTDHTIEDRIAETLQHAGVSVFFTSITDMIAFLVGISSVFPSIQQFCAYTATGILFAFVYQVLFFSSALALDAHREYMEVRCWYGIIGKGWLWGGAYNSSKVTQTLFLHASVFQFPDGARRKSPSFVSDMPAIQPPRTPCLLAARSDWMTFFHPF